jgi:hypothetical protein
MELIKFLAASAAEWIRDAAINVSGRILEQVVGDRIKRRGARRKTRRKPTRRG